VQFERDFIKRILQFHSESTDKKISRSILGMKDTITVGSEKQIETICAGSTERRRKGPRSATIVLGDGLAGNPEFVRSVLASKAYELLRAETAPQLFEILNSASVDLIILPCADSDFPGLDCCRRIKADRKTELVPVLIVTDGKVGSQIEALSAGADDFLPQPVHRELARTRVRALLRQKAATDRLEQTEAILFTLAKAVEQRDQTTSGHCDRLGLVSLALGLALGVSEEDLEALYRGGYLHDIGKVGIPDQILFKPGPLNEEEWKTMRTHPERGEEICKPLRSIERVLPIIRSHHERFDGSGYPDGLRGEQIPFLARILQLADIYDALTNARPYKDGMSGQDALELMQEETRQGWRDPELMRVFVRLHGERLGSETWQDAREMRTSLRNLQAHLVQA
jgi:putative two-component system response regulator